MPDDLRTANLLGALSLALADRQHEAAAQGGQAPAALTILAERPGLSIDGLRRPLGLSHSATVRLVDGLERAGLVVRAGATRDARAVALSLTAQGEAEALTIQAARRGHLLAPLTSALNPQEREALAGYLEKLLASLTGGDIERAYRICRLCDYRACVDCPVAVAAQPDPGHER
jgi:MarR family transcriptional regulator, negative regulator of the multidrug operon emrRAB